MGLLRYLEIIVVEADRAEAKRHPKHDPDVGIAGVGPQQRRNNEPRQDHETAHGGRALLGDEMRLRAIGPDWLALALPQPQSVDDGRAEQKHENTGGEHRAAGAGGDVAKYIENRDRVGEIGQPIKHAISPALAPVRALWRRNGAAPA